MVIIEIARSYVNHDPSQGCSTGLHVGTYAYAKGYARSALLEVHVNPRDVVSVPTDCDAQKVRVTAAKVVKAEAVEYDTAFPPSYDPDDVSVEGECPRVLRRRRCRGRLLHLLRHLASEPQHRTSARPRSPGRGHHLLA